MMPGGLSWPEAGAQGAAGAAVAPSGASHSGPNHDILHPPGDQSNASGAATPHIRNDQQHHDAAANQPAGSTNEMTSRSMNAADNETAVSSANTAAGNTPHASQPLPPAASNAYQPRALPRELRSGPFRLSAAERKLWKQGTEIVLTPTEWTLVELLMERAGEGLSRDAILDAVWGRHFIGDLKIVDVNIRRIRQKLEDEPSDPQFIETLWGFGYRWKRSDR
ncbi:winged helix-turn-helix domain-containing protein [Paenibacillus solisilvae]|uniref:Winged helix-turn-helix domain-containing protein n=1 Tax=Paenibacillus solisilvae TaxID=2486751 RepID=A0ABW0VZT8_9BACL